ncbi:MAG: spore cortex biosynthesis protein YabQ [Oscillospiraceae bacterium]
MMSGLFTGGIETFFTVPQQVFIFLCSVILGGALGVVYDVFRAVRIIFPFLGRKIPTAAADILYMIIFGLAVFLLSALMGRGVVRFFCIAGAAIGAVLYLTAVGNTVTGLLRRLCGGLRKAFSKLKRTAKKKNNDA